MLGSVVGRDTEVFDPPHGHFKEGGSREKEKREKERQAEQTNTNTNTHTHTHTHTHTQAIRLGNEQRHVPTCCGPHTHYMKGTGGSRKQPFPCQIHLPGDLLCWV